MTVTTVPAVVTGQTYLASDYNTYVKDNINSLNVGTTAGDMVYWTNSSTPTRLAIGTAGQFQKSSGTAPVWAALGMVTAKASMSAASDQYGYGTNTWRDVPNSAADITPTQTSTVFVWGAVMNSADASSLTGFRDFQVRIDGVDVGIKSSETYQTGEVVTTAVMGLATGVTAGAKSIRLREIATAGNYTVSGWQWFAMAIPE